jgi:hypothetical protein
METSTIYSIGTALGRARDHEHTVEVLVAGVWMTGRVVALDGHGVVLEAHDAEYSIARLDSVQAVRVHASLPVRSIPAQLTPVTG